MRKKETTQQLIKRIKRSVTIRTNRIARAEGFPRGYEQLIKESPIKIKIRRKK